MCNTLSDTLGNNCYLGIFITGHKKQISHIRELYFFTAYSKGMALLFCEERLEEFGFFWSVSMCI